MPEQAKNKVVFGLSNVHVAKMTGDNEWDTPVHIPGAVNMSVDPEGDQSVFNADNMAYHTTNTNSGYSGELEMALIPDEVLAWMLGWKVDANGALVEVADGVPTPFALMFNVQGDQRARSAVFYKVTASRPSDEHATTEDTAEPDTTTLPFTITPIVYNGETVTKSAIEKSETNAAVYDTFFTKVYMPDATAGEEA